MQCSLFYSYLVCVFENNACHVCERSELAYKMLLKRLFDRTLKMDDQFWTVKKLLVVKLIDLNNTFLTGNWNIFSQTQVIFFSFSNKKVFVVIVKINNSNIVILPSCTSYITWFNFIIYKKKVKKTTYNEAPSWSSHLHVWRWLAVGMSVSRRASFAAGIAAARSKRLIFN